MGIQDELGQVSPKEILAYALRYRSKHVQYMYNVYSHIIDWKKIGYHDSPPASSRRPESHTDQLILE